MKRSGTAGLAGLAVVGLLLGCDGSNPSPTYATPITPPVAAAPAPPTTPAPPGPPQTLSGYVADTAFRPLADVILEVVNGPDAGKTLTSDAGGRFSYVGQFVGVSMRATKAGYDTRSAVVFVNGSNAWVSFALAPMVPPVQVAGNYTLTLTVDNACDGFPDEVRSRSYSAVVTSRRNSNFPPDTAFDGIVLGTFAPYGNVFWIGVAGDYVSVTTEGEGPTIVEKVGDGYIAYYGRASAVVSTTGLPTLSAPFTGVIEYCELKAPIGQYYDCSPALAAVRVECTSPNSHLTLTPR